ncbi:MAG: LTA synthase family protein [Alphaproteobacteria bacterium]
MNIRSNKVTKYSWLNLLAIFFLIELILRFFLTLKYLNNLDKNFLEFFKIFSIGLFFDFLTFCYLTAIPLLYYLSIPTNIFNRPRHIKFLKIIYFIFLNIIIFSFFSEVVFFDEFDTRFNFIAVDYLIYTTEVIENILESYPMTTLLSIIILISSVIFIFTKQKIFLNNQNIFKSRLKFVGVIFAVILAEFFLIDSSKLDKFFTNNYHKELSQNGIYQLFSAYRNNQIEYDKFYSNIDQDFAIQNLRKQFLSQNPHIKFINSNDIDRIIFPSQKQQKIHPNIFIVTLESMSANFMKHFGNDANLTPNLDKLADEGIFFTNLKATGTRTVRGLEAISLGTLPTPGNSIVRRKNNEDLFNIYSPLKNLGYEAKFLYGGDGFFDNMNYFFSHNGYQIIDKKQFKKSEITFANAWGVADEDLYNKALSEADKSFNQNQHFLNFLMTTSNHRPYTYPSGKTDIPSKTGRLGAVKYADYAIGEFIKNAKTKPWFDKTIFVFVADHCAGSAGNTDVPIWRYQIPAIIYAPKILKPQIFTQNASQIDIAPTVLGLLNIEYKSKFFGSDLLHDKKNSNERAFVSTYSDLGYFTKNQLYLLKLKKNNKVYDVTINGYGFNASIEKPSENFVNEFMQTAISYYQTANYYFKSGKLKEFAE